MAQKDVVDILTADHREMIGLLELIEETTDPAERRALADAATAEIVRHSVAEELFVYPVYTREVTDGADEVEHDKEEHQELEETLVKLEVERGKAYTVVPARLGRTMVSIQLSSHWDRVSRC